VPQEGRAVWATARFISKSQNVSCIGDFSTDNAMPKVSTGPGGVDFFLLIRGLSWVFEIFSGARPSKTSKHSWIELRFA